MLSFKGDDCRDSMGVTTLLTPISDGHNPKSDTNSSASIKSPVDDDRVSGRKENPTVSGVSEYFAAALYVRRGVGALDDGNRGFIGSVKGLVVSSSSEDPTWPLVEGPKAKRSLRGDLDTPIGCTK